MLFWQPQMPPVNLKITIISKERNVFSDSSIEWTASKSGGRSRSGGRGSGGTGESSGQTEEQLKSGGVFPGRTLMIPVEENCNVLSIKARLAHQLGENADNIKLVFAGKPLLDDFKITSLDFGPETAVYAVISCEIAKPDRKKGKIPSSLNVPAAGCGEERSEIRSYFHVYCKMGCEKLQRGKLRVRCSGCKSSGVVLEEEPSCWNDVLSAPHLPCRCFSGSAACENDTFAEFFFRCTQCSEQSPGLDVVPVPLPQVKSNTESSMCAICGEIRNPVFRFSCQLPHMVCLDCFVAYARIALNERLFRLTDDSGYTLPCPVSGCGGFVSDPHAFRLLGPELYRKFQTFGTESYLLGENGVFCPQPSCGEGFLVETDAETILLMCPNCGHSFCRSCKCGASECECSESNARGKPSASPSASGDIPASDNQKSMETIRKVCKQCPRCRVKTERSGGCHHMSCRQCGFNWCWLCGKEWTDECQWDHWFD